jgi:S1-C subfamily serine protease
MQGIVELSQDLERLVTTAGRSAVWIEGRRGPPAPGAVWSADGVVVAAHHLVEDADGLQVGLPGGELVRAEVVGRDPSSDLAVLRAAAAGLVPASFGEPPGLGAGALVVGVSRSSRGPRAELGLVHRASGEWRAPSGASLERLLELSLPLRPGFSGTLAVAASGACLGLATAGLWRGRATVVPAAALARLVPALLEHGELRRGYLGVATLPVRAPGGAGQPGALLVTAVEPESPADRAGLLLGDALLSIGEVRLDEPGDLMALLDPRRVGERVRLRLWRAGAAREAELAIGARPARGGER